MSSFKEPKTLKDFLDLWYQSSIYGVSAAGDNVVDLFKAKAAEIPSLMDEAREKLKAMEGVSDERCFITRTNRQFINKVLN